MKAARIVKPKQSLEVQELEIPKPKGLQVLIKVQSGIVTVNNIVASDPRVPFKGVKKSGFGRELSKYGMLEFANIKSVRFYDKLVDYHHVE